MSKMSEHAHDIEMLAVDVWQAVNRLNTAPHPKNLEAHRELLEEAQATLAAILDQIKRKKAA